MAHRKGGEKRMRRGGATLKRTFALVMCMPAIIVMSIAAMTFASEAGSASPAGRDLFGTRGGAKKPALENAPVPATVTWSAGRKETGKLSFTSGVPLKVYDLEKKEWVDVELGDLASLTAAPRAEKMDREWRWKDYGDDEKVYTGRERPRRWLDHELLLKDGARMKVHVKGTVMYFDTVPETVKPKTGKKGADKKLSKQAEIKPQPVRRRLIIRQYSRGNWGDTLESLVYVKRIEVGEPKSLPKRPGAE